MARKRITKAHVQAIAAADQENARLQEERNASPTGQTASERAMAATKKRKAKPAKRQPKQIKVVEEETPVAPPTKVSQIDAAWTVLRQYGQAMGTKQMCETITAAGLWRSPGGKTPHATLYSAIIREIAVKGAASRFRKSDRGRFEAV